MRGTTLVMVDSDSGVYASKEPRSVCVVQLRHECNQGGKKNASKEPRSVCVVQLEGFVDGVEPSLLQRSHAQCAWYNPVARTLFLPAWLLQRSHAQCAWYNLLP